ncbi:GNAT family N-acetyltransferase [Paenibacillus sp. NEAU-GSW1]|nr:GNAT family N-acetyltransferase [Paenibacillus sp. NEAU-GSW1]
MIVLQDIRITRNGELNSLELNELFRTNNWQVEPHERLDNSIRSTWGWITARRYDDNQLIGFVQVISDGIRHAYILKMIVHPNYRRHGIGSKIMTELMELLKENELVPTLVATPGNDNYYKKFGFEAESNGFKAMCIR